MDVVCSSNSGSPVIGRLKAGVYGTQPDTAIAGKRITKAKMNRLISLLCVLGCTYGYLFGQSTLPGWWKGYLTVGLNSDKGYVLELFVRQNGRELSGRSRVYLSSTYVVEMEWTGRLYDDSSLHIEEIRSQTLPGLNVPFKRKYQLLLNRGIYETSLKGFWQEINEDPLHPQRERGRVMLERAPPGKA
jgi:hypothetical protein